MMRFKNILVPYDGSEHADRALDVAGDFLRSNPEARVHVISVTYVALDAADFNPDPPNEDEQYNLLGYEMYEEVFSQEQKAAHRAMVQAASEILPGHRARSRYLRHDHSSFSSRGHRRLRTAARSAISSLWAVVVLAVFASSSAALPKKCSIASTCPS